MNKNFLFIIILFFISILFFIMCAGKNIDDQDNSNTNSDNDVLTATGKSIDYNMRKHGIPAEYIPFDYPIPDGLIENDDEKQKMIDAKIEHIKKLNDIYWGDLPGEEDDRLTTFADINNFINSNFTGFKGLDLDWDKVTSELYEEVEYAENYGDVAYALTMLGFSLQEGHTRIIPGRLDSNISDNITLPNYLLKKSPVIISYPITRMGACYTVTQDEELVISKLYDASENPYNLKKGDEIVGFNGIPWQEWIEHLIKAKIPVYGSPAAEKSAVRYNLLKSGMANINLFEKINIKRIDTGQIETMDIKYLDPLTNGFTVCTDLTQAKGLDDWREQTLTYGTLEDTNIGYIYLLEFPSGFEQFLISGEDWDPYITEFSDKFEEALLSLMETDGIIIDLRYNVGGRPEPIYKGLAHLVDFEEEIQFFSAAGRDTSVPDMINLVEIENYTWVPLKPDEENLSYDNPIIVMTGPDCISACDMAIALFSKLDNFTIIGKHPNGSATQISGDRMFYIGSESDQEVISTYLTNFTFYFRDDPHNYLMRRTDFLDEEIWFSKEDLENGIDTVRNYAIELITKNNS